MDPDGTVFCTRHLRVRRAAPEDVGLFRALWSDPRVMKQVGFPSGLGLGREDIAARLLEQPAGVLDAYLVVELQESGRAIGECKLSRPDQRGIATTDIKLLPRFWGRGYGTEIKRGLLDYLFTHTACTAVEATPHIHNHASIRMQEAVGGRRVGEGVYHFPVVMGKRTAPVPHFIYRVYREDWEEAQERPTSSKTG